MVGWFGYITSTGVYTYKNVDTLIRDCEIEALVKLDRNRYMQEDSAHYYSILQ